MNKFLVRKILALVVAIIAVIAVYFYTETTIQSKVAPTNVVVATKDIPPHTKITKDMVTVIEVPMQALPSNNTYGHKLEDVVGKWTVEGYGISAKAFINTKKILPKEELPDSGLLDLKNGEYAFTTNVTLQTSNGNTIRPGTKVDLYLSADISKKSLVDAGAKETSYLEDNVHYFGRVVKNARVLEVKDSRGNNVFTADQYTEGDKAAKTTSKSNNSMAKVYTVAIDIEDFDLASKGSRVGEIIPVVSGSSYNKLNTLKDSIGKDLPSNMSDIKETKKLIEHLTLKIN